MSDDASLAELREHLVARVLETSGIRDGSLAGPERTVTLQPGLSVMLPDGLTLADGQELDGAALAAYLDGPAAEFATGVRARSPQIYWGLGPWLAAGDRRSCGLADERAGESSPLAQMPLQGRRMRVTAGILDSGGIAVLSGTGKSGSGRLSLQVAGFGPHGSDLGAALAAHVRAWDQAGQPGLARLHVDALPRSSPGETAPASPASDVLVIERPSTRFIVYHT